MTAIVRAVSRNIRSITVADVLTQLILICGAILLVFLLSLTHGLDLSPGFF